jgi:hypothetical protein
MRWAVLAVLAASVALAGCGGSSGDLLGMQITGGPGKVKEQMHVTEDGRTSCNTGKLQQLPSQAVLDARNIEREAKPLIQEGGQYPLALPGRRTFELRTPDGSLIWGEGQAGLPALLPQAELLALKLQDYCPKGG